MTIAKTPPHPHHQHETTSGPKGAREECALQHDKEVDTLCVQQF